MIERIIIAVLTTLGSKLLGLALEYINGKKEQKKTNENIDDRLEALKKAHLAAADGLPVTPEQRKAYHEALRNFVRGSNPNGL